MKFENTQVFNFENAFRGMRNPKDQWDKSDSYVRYIPEEHANEFVIGPKDMKLAQTLIRSGPEHRKFMRQIFVSVDITAPIYWLQEFDTYKVGTVANSTSKMHTIQNSPITLERFEIDDYHPELEVFDYPEYDIELNKSVSYIIDFLEALRNKYIETGDKRYWKELIRWLPIGWLQKRTVTMNYENLLSICSKGQRRNHKLNEWSGIDKQDVEYFIKWARSLPYAKELIFIDEN